ncbi:unnamed protein product [Amoebophrya sp. A120]|nr:unnamed protein product [Amoebophrya sp. A120]|eukprot:GSA120T00023775001.1
MLWFQKLLLLRLAEGEKQAPQEFRTAQLHSLPLFLATKLFVKEGCVVQKPLLLQVTAHVSSYFFTHALRKSLAELPAEQSETKMFLLSQVLAQTRCSGCFHLSIFSLQQHQTNTIIVRN